MTRPLRPDRSGGAHLTGRPLHDLALTGGPSVKDCLWQREPQSPVPTARWSASPATAAALYTPQALWTMARERLDVITVVFANRAYRILNIELGRVGVVDARTQGQGDVDLNDPDIDWQGLAQAFGVEASRVESIEAFDRQFADAMRGRGPRLIEAVI